MEQQYKQSVEPIFWGMFGFGGMVIAMAVPALLICMIVAGFTDGQQMFHITQVMQHWWGAGALFLILMGIVFHCVHRLYFSLHDLKLNTGKCGMIVLYGLATLVTLSGAGALALYYINNL